MMPGVLAQQPDTAGWWLTRPLWLTAYTIVTLPFLLAFGRFERPTTGASYQPVAVWRQLLGCSIACFGLAMLVGVFA